MTWHQLFDTSVLFYGRDILVVAKHFKTDRCVVTFSSRHDDDSLSPREPFGSSLLEKEKTSYISLISFRNHWWITEEFKPAMERIADHIREQGYDTVIGYGGSMGGVGVIHSSAYLPYDKAVVFGAQYDISPDVAPWDPRWHSDAHKYGISLKSGSDAASPDVEFVYMYDPFSLDRRHMELFQSYLRVTPVAFSFSGHETFRTLKEVGLASETLKNLLLSTESLAQMSFRVRERYRSKRRTSSRVFKNLMELAIQKKKQTIATWASQKLAVLGYQDIASLHMLGLAQLTNEKDAKGSEAFYDQALALGPDHPASWRGKAKCRQFAQDRKAAVTYAVAALARRADSADLSRVVMETAYQANNRRLLTLTSARYIENFPDERDSDFYKKFSASVTKQVSRIPKKDLRRFEEVLELIRTRRPYRYAQLYQTIAVQQPKNMAEIGVFNGETALHMIKVARNIRPSSAAPLEYFGFDLFEDMTPEIHSAELSKIPLSQKEVADKLGTSGAKISLFKGLTQNTLPEARKRLRAQNKYMDFVFLDGGHKKETIASDWKDVVPLLRTGSVVILDDFYINPPASLLGFGCNDLVQELRNTPSYDVELLPVQDTFEKEFGTLSIAMVQVRVL